MTLAKILNKGNNPEQTKKYILPSEVWANTEKLMKQLDVVSGNDKDHNSYFNLIVYGVVTSIQGETYATEIFEQEYTKLRDVIAKKYGEEKAIEIFIGFRGNKTKTSVPTTHPTETLTREGIAAKKQLFEVLYNAGGLELFSNEKRFSDLSQKNQNAVENAFKALYKATSEVPTYDMVILWEIIRNIGHSERFTESISHSNKIVSKALDLKQGDVTSNLLKKIQPYYRIEGWDGGDQDNKPNSTASLLEKRTIEMSPRAMNQKYILELAKISTSAQKFFDKKASAGELSNSDKADFENFLGDIRGIMMRKMFELDDESKINYGVEPKPEHFEVIDKFIKSLKQGGVGALKASRSEIKGIESVSEFRKLSRIDRKNLINSFAAGKEVTAAKLQQEYQKLQELLTADYKEKYNGSVKTPLSEREYKTHNDFHNALFHLKDNYERFMPYTKGSAFKQLDNLIIVSNTHEKYATKTQLRQNHEDIEIAYGQMLKLFNKSAKLESLGYDPKKENDVDYVLSFVDKNFKEVSKTIQQHLFDKKDYMMGLHALRRESSLDAEKSKELKFYEVMASLVILNEHHDAIPKKIIAEFPVDPKDAARASKMNLALSLAASVHGQKTQTSILELFENEQDIKNMSKLINALKKSPEILSHLERINANGLRSYDPETNQYQIKTIGEAKASLAIKEKSVNDDKPLIGKKDKMDAGSDSMKGMGVFVRVVLAAQGANISRNAVRLGLEIVNEEGTGSGLHRKYPSYGELQTIQGRDLNSSPQGLALRIEGFLLNEMVRSLYVKGVLDKAEISEFYEKSHRYNIDMLNPFNSLSEEARKMLPAAEKCALQATAAYSKYYQSEIMEDTVSTATLSDISKLVSFADRGASRARAAVDKNAAYPAKTDHKNFRAIQFGLANAVAEPHLFIGTNEFFKAAESISPGKSLEFYEKLTSVQSTINSVIDGACMADFRAKWKFIEIERISEKGERSINIKNSKGEHLKINLKEFGNEFDSVESIVAIDKVRKFTNSELSERSLNTIRGLAYEDNQHDQALSRLINLQKDVLKKEGISFNPVAGLDKQQQLIEMMPEYKKDAIKDRNNRLGEAFTKLADLHVALTHGKLTLPKKTGKGIEGDKQLYKKLVYTAGLVLEAIETPLVANEHQHVAKAIEKERQILAQQNRVS